MILKYPAQYFNGTGSSTAVACSLFWLNYILPLAEQPADVIIGRLYDVVSYPVNVDR